MSLGVSAAGASRLTPVLQKPIQGTNLGDYHRFISDPPLYTVRILLHGATESSGCEPLMPSFQSIRPMMMMIICRSGGRIEFWYSLL